MGRLKDKVAVITGAASGLGLATTTRFAEQGACVLAVDLHRAALDEVAAAAGPRVSGFAADVTDPEQVQAALAAAVELYGGIDVLFPNAGIWGTVSDIAGYTPSTSSSA